MVVKNLDNKRKTFNWNDCNLTYQIGRAVESPILVVVGGCDTVSNLFKL